MGQHLQPAGLTPSSLMLPTLQPAPCLTPGLLQINLFITPTPVLSVFCSWVQQLSNLNMAECRICLNGWGPADMPEQIKHELADYRYRLAVILCTNSILNAPKMYYISYLTFQYNSILIMHVVSGCDPPKRLTIGYHVFHPRTIQPANT